MIDYFFLEKQKPSFFCLHLLILASRALTSKKRGVGVGVGRGKGGTCKNEMRHFSVCSRKGGIGTVKRESLAIILL